MLSLMLAVIFLIVTPAWFAFAGISMWKRQWKQALTEMTVGIVFAAILVIAFSTMKG